MNLLEVKPSLLGTQGDLQGVVEAVAVLCKSLKLAEGEALRALAAAPLLLGVQPRALVRVHCSPARRTLLEQQTYPSPSLPSPSFVFRRAPGGPGFQTHSKPCGGACSRDLLLPVAGLACLRRGLGHVSALPLGS